ncbi:MAG: hypothetical protein FWD47_15695 [Treponema sp.]|nr:hypothetical protein [Treponema sp.]
MTSKIFDPLMIGNKTIPNRLLAQAMEGNDCENGGQPSERTVSRYEKLANGKWGTVVIEAVSVVETSLARVNGMIINKKNLDSIKRLIDIFKSRSNESIILIQLTHSGRYSGVFSDKVSVTPSDENSARFLSADEISHIRDRFIEAGFLAQQAGADGIDIKMCHGYFGCEILRPSNTRNDEWGTSFENRTRFLRETTQGIKNLVKDNFILGSRLSLYEGIKGGCGTAGINEIIEDFSEMFNVIKLMDNLGMDYVNISAGIPAVTGTITRPVEPSKYLALHQLRYAKMVKDMVKNKNLGLKVIGSAYSTYKEEAVDIANDMLCRDYVDLCGFGRQIFADPLTPKKLISGEKINWCVLCSGCSKLMLAQINDGCIVYDDYYKQLNRDLK